MFTGLPNSAVIRIINSSGDLIKTLYHEKDSSMEEWYLKNEYNQLIAPGVYFYHIKSPLGEKTGKFIVIL